MASPLTHAVVAATLAVEYRVPLSRRCRLLGIACAEIPDLDAIGFWLGVPYGSFFGHRGITHSLLFAAFVSWGLSRWASRWEGVGAGTLWSYLFLATASHGFLDALTDGGLGVAFFSPFDQSRYFLPVRPIHVSSMSLHELLGEHGLDVLANEFVWVWVPCAVVAARRWWWRRRTPISSA